MLEVPERLHRIVTCNVFELAPARPGRRTRVLAGVQARSRLCVLASPRSSAGAWTTAPCPRRSRASTVSCSSTRRSKRRARASTSIGTPNALAMLSAVMAFWSRTVTDALARSSCRSLSQLGQMRLRQLRSHEEPATRGLSHLSQLVAARARESSTSVDPIRPDCAGLAG